MPQKIDLRRRPEVTPLQFILNATLRMDVEMQPEPLPIDRPFSLGFFLHGKAKAKARSEVGVDKLGHAFHYTSSESREKEDALRECFFLHMDQCYPDYVRYLPMAAKMGTVELHTWFLFPPPRDFYPGMPHQKNPDFDNALKLVQDALSGRASRRPGLAVTDDRIVTGRNEGFKCYWDPEWQDTPGYPPSPGTYFKLIYRPYPRHPSFLDYRCPGCGRANFKTETGLLKHTRKCLEAVKLPYGELEEEW